MSGDAQLVFGVATRGWTGAPECVNSWQRTASCPYPELYAVDMTVMDAYQYILDKSEEPIIAYIHDDVVIHEQDWDTRVLKQFNDPAVGLVGFAGAPGFGHPRMYEVPYDPGTLGRIGFRSNMRNWQVHGGHFTGEQDCAILDGFAMIVRRSVLEEAGGWPVHTAVGYYCYDYWLCCETRRQGRKIRLVGIDCEHLGARTANMVPVREDASAAHRYIWDNFKSVLPAMVEVQ